jgi:hypothetical protein
MDKIAASQDMLRLVGEASMLSTHGRARLVKLGSEPRANATTPRSPARSRAASEE